MVFCTRGYELERGHVSCNTCSLHELLFRLALTDLFCAPAYAPLQIVVERLNMFAQRTIDTIPLADVQQPASSKPLSTFRVPMPRKSRLTVTQPFPHLHNSRTTHPQQNTKTFLLRTSVRSVESPIFLDVFPFDLDLLANTPLLGEAVGMFFGYMRFAKHLYNLFPIAV